MTDLAPLRATYLSDKGICPNSIPGKRCLAGDWDHAPALAERIEAARLKNLPEMVDE